MAKSQWSFKSAIEISAALKARKVSSVELTEDAIGRIERHDGKINAICVRDFSRALDAARAADAALGRGEHRPLLGIPLTVKESFNIAGLPTTWGFPEQKNFVPQQDALSVTRMKEAGGVILGKTNVPIGLGDWQSYNDIYGTTNNPYDLARTPGGSSGGSSAALAAGYGPLSIGTDIGGSLRVPAFHCGVFAHKPTFGLVASRGHTPPPRHTALKDFRVLLIETDPLLPTDKDVRAGIERLADHLGKAGVPVTRKSPLWPDFAASSRLYMRMLLSFLGATFQPDIYAGAQAAAAQLASDDISLRAERLRGIALSYRERVMAEGGRTRLRAQWRELFNSFDAVICPIMPTPAYVQDHAPEQETRRINIDGKDYAYPDQLAWPGVATLPGLPATAIPTGFSPAGLPIGVQIVGPFLEDRTPLKLAELIEREFCGFVPPPMFDD